MGTVMLRHPRTVFGAAEPRLFAMTQKECVPPPIPVRVVVKP
jgi:hypothetical protein